MGGLCGCCVVRISPLWSPHLDTVLCYREADVRPCFEHLWKYYNTCFPTPDGVADV